MTTTAFSDTAIWASIVRQNILGALERGEALYLSMQGDLGRRVIGELIQENKVHVRDAAPLDLLALTA